MFIITLIKHLENHPSDNSDLVTGFEWEDPLHINRLSVSENRRATLLLTKIAHTVRLRDIVLRPYFQDYELVQVFDNFKSYFLTNIFEGI